MGFQNLLSIFLQIQFFQIFSLNFETLCIRTYEKDIIVEYIYILKNLQNKWSRSTYKTKVIFLIRSGNCEVIVFPDAQINL